MKLQSYGICLVCLICNSGFSQDYEERLAALEDKAYQHFYSNKDSTYYYFDEINELALANNQFATAIDNLNYVCFSAGYFYDLDKIKSTIDEADQLVQKNSNVLDTLPDRGEFQKNYLNFNKGIYFHKLEDFKKAKFYFSAIVKQILRKPNYQDNIDYLDLLSQCYNFIAQMNAVQKRYEIANDYYEKNIRLFQRFKSNDIEGLHKVYNLYGNSLYEEGNYEKAKTLWLTSLAFNEKNYTQRNRNSFVTTSILLSKVYKDLNQIDSATYFLNKINQYSVENDPFVDRYLIAKGEIHIKEANYTKALQTFEDAIRVSLETDKPRLRKKIGDLYFEMSDAKKALQNYDKGITELSATQNSVVNESNLNPAAVGQKNTLLSLLAARAKTLATMRDSNAKLAVLGSVDLGLETLDLLKPTFKNQTDKLGLIEDAFTLFEVGVETAYQLCKTSNDQKYIDTAFEYFEKSKSVLLLEAILGAKATQFANIPDTLLEHERRLKSAITFIEKQLNQATKADIDKEDRLFELQEEHRQLISKIETDYKDYYDLKYNTQTLPLIEAQKLLKYNEKLISYFYGNEAIYAIGVDKNSKHIERIPLSSSLEKEIKEVHHMLSDPKSDISVLATLSNKLFSKLVAPVVTPNEKQKLIIITDGLLNYIPFGALNTKANGLVYLIEKNALSYVNSATLYAHLSARNKQEGNLLAFAPNFSGEQVQIDPNRANLLPLPHNKREVKQILNSFPGRSFINEKASLQNFTSQLSKYRILHLATHAVFNDAAPEYSFLAFSTANKEENLLYVSDLYNLQIQAELITLSACESGVGELKRGEGFLSLARGFFFSGASSIASTLWKINDASTTSLMDSFYKNLADTYPKDLALQKAKRSFLDANRQNGLSHPYYWSGFIISGNTASLMTNSYWVWIALGTLLTVVAGFFVFGKKEG